MMIRLIAVTAILATFVTALQSHADYWVMTMVNCPIETAETPNVCAVQSTACPAQPASEESVSCCDDSEDSTCPKAASDCMAISEEICVQLTCPVSDEKPKCCVLVHPFWVEPPLKLTFHPPNPSALMPEPGRLIEFASLTFIPEKHIPPWGVHPVISTTVLRL